MLLLQVLHSAVVKQLEIAKLLDNLQESKFRVSLLAKTAVTWNIINSSMGNFVHRNLINMNI